MNKILKRTVKKSNCNISGSNTTVIQKFLSIPWDFMHTDPVVYGQKVCTYTILEYCLLARLSAHTDWISSMYLAQYPRLPFCGLMYIYTYNLFIYSWYLAHDGQEWSGRGRSFVSRYLRKDLIQDCKHSTFTLHFTSANFKKAS